MLSSTNNTNNNNDRQLSGNGNGSSSLSSSSTSSSASSTHPLQRQHHQNNIQRMQTQNVLSQVESCKSNLDIHKVAGSFNIQHNRNLSNASTITTTRVPPCLPLPSPPLQCYQQPQHSLTATTTTSLSSSPSLSSNNSSVPQHHHMAPPSPVLPHQHHHYYGMDSPTLISSGTPSK